MTNSQLTALPILDPHGTSFAVTESDLDGRGFADLLDRHKALVFRRAPPLSVQDFGSFVVARQLQDYPYVGGAAPRRVIPVEAAPGKDIVFTANERYVQYVDTVMRRHNQGLASHPTPIIQSPGSTHSLSSRIGPNAQSALVYFLLLRRASREGRRR